MTSRTPRKTEKTGLEPWSDKRRLRHVFSKAKDHRNEGKSFNFTDYRRQGFQGLEYCSVVQLVTNTAGPSAQVPSPGAELFPLYQLRLINSTSESTKEVPSLCLPSWVGRVWGRERTGKTTNSNCQRARTASAGPGPGVCVDGVGGLRLQVQYPEVQGGPGERTLTFPAR